jgi:hypothetical protein
MQDGALPNFALPIRVWHESSRDWWIGRRRQIEWRPLIYDPDSCDFFLWGWDKLDVCRAKPTPLDTLEQQIRDTFATVHVDYFRESVESVSSSFWTSAQDAGVCI